MAVLHTGIWWHVLPVRSAWHLWQLCYARWLLHVAPLWGHWHQRVQAQGNPYATTTFQCTSYGACMSDITPMKVQSIAVV